MRLRRIRLVRAAAAFAAAALFLALPAFAGPPTTFPATYDCTSVARQTIRATAAGRTVTQRDQVPSAGPVTFADARTLSFVSGDPEFPDTIARYRTNSKGVVRYTLTRASRRDFLSYFRRQFRASGLRGTTTLTFGTGRIEFSEDGTTLDGRQTIRLGFSGAFRGIAIEMTGVVRMTFTGALVP